MAPGYAYLCYAAGDSDVVLWVMGIEMGIQMQMQMQMSYSMLRLMLLQEAKLEIDARHVGTLTPLELSRLVKKWIEWS